MAEGSDVAPASDEPFQCRDFGYTLARQGRCSIGTSIGRRKWESSTNPNRADVAVPSRPILEHAAAVAVPARLSLAVRI